MRNSVSSVVLWFVATSDLPNPATHSWRSLCTIATDKPGVWVPARIVSNCCRSSAIDRAGVALASFLICAQQTEEQTARRITPQENRLRFVTGILYKDR